MNPWIADFPILAADENGNRLVYLDSAATTQHPTQVLDAVADYYRRDNANPHRGVYELAMRATDAHENARHTVAKFFNAQDDEIVFTQNTTESLNLVAYSYGLHFLHAGDEIALSVAEHHSNLVPWQRVAAATGAKLVYLYPDEGGHLTEQELDKKITDRTRLVAVAMVSNVLGLRAPVESIVRHAHAVGAVVVLDCAQSAPHVPVDVKALDVDGVTPGEDTVKDGSYKVQRPFVLVTVEGKALSPVAQAFFDYATSPDAAAIIAKAGAVAAN